MNYLLKDIRVVEQGTFISGPCAGMMLADLGADVIKIEAPGDGDPYRSFGSGLYSAHFQAYNRNKRSLSLDLKSQADKETFLQLIRNADVYLQNFRPGVADRIGADYETLSKINPRLIYCSISGFGKDGPQAQRPVYDSVAQAVSGFLSVATDATAPRFLGPALADAITGIYASLGVTAALAERSKSGRGRHVEVSMLEAMMHFAVEPFMAYLALGEVPTSMDRPRVAQAYIVKCADGGAIAFHLSSPQKFWDELVKATGGVLADDNRFSTRKGRIENYAELQKELDRIFALKPRDYWLKHLADSDVPHAPVSTVPEVMENPQVEHLKMIVPVSGRQEGAEQSVRPPYNVDGVRAADVLAAPLLDQHGPQIRSALTASPESWPASGIR